LPRQSWPASLASQLPAPDAAGYGRGVRCKNSVPPARRR
jgi:hypothetical protein